MLDLACGGMDYSTPDSSTQAVDVASALGMGPSGYAVSKAFRAFVCSHTLFVGSGSVATAFECAHHSPEYGLRNPPRSSLAGRSVC